MDWPQTTSKQLFCLLYPYQARAVLGLQSKYSSILYDLLLFLFNLKVLLLGTQT